MARAPSGGRPRLHGRPAGKAEKVPPLGRGATLGAAAARVAGTGRGKEVRAARLRATGRLLLAPGRHRAVVAAAEDLGHREPAHDQRARVVRVVEEPVAEAERVLRGTL